MNHHAGEPVSIKVFSEQLVGLLLKAVKQFESVGLFWWFFFLHIVSFISPPR